MRVICLIIKKVFLNIFLMQTRSSKDRQEVLPNDTTLSRVLLEKCKTYLWIRRKDICERLSNEIEELRVNASIVQSFNVHCCFITGNMYSRYQWRTALVKNELHTVLVALWVVAMKSKNQFAVLMDTSTGMNVK